MSIQKGGIQKIEAVAKFPIPANQHDIRRFIVLASFFRRFVREFALIAGPLTNLLKKDTAWQWTAAEDNAFSNLKQLLIARPVLALYNQSVETQLHTDASKLGLAGILLKRNQICGDLWRSIAGKPLLMSKNLLGIKFTIVTDCNVLRSTFTKRDFIPRISRWWIQFMEYDCEIAYRAGDKMAHVDALSRSPVADERDTLHTLDILNVH